jgi:hypothetical protein
MSGTRAQGEAFLEPSPAMVQSLMKRERSSATVRRSVPEPGDKTMNLLVNIKPIALAGCLLVPFAAVPAERLNIKPGLWEVKSVTQMSGVLPIPKEFRDKLTPEQLATMAANAKAEAAKGPVTDVSRECITEKDIEEPFHGNDMKECRQSSITTTRTTQEIRMLCEGEHKGSGVLKVTAPTPETMTGTMDMRLGDGADAFTVKAKLTGRRLGADCGDEAEDEGDVDTDEEPADDPEEEEE